MAMTRIGISAGLERDDGSRPFPSYDLTSLVDAPGIEAFRLPQKRVLEASDLAGADAVILLGERIEVGSFADDGRLAAVIRIGVGYDTIDVGACTDRDVVLTIAPPGVQRPMAVAILTFMLALAARLPTKDGIARRGAPAWSERVDHHGVGLVGRTLGSVGMGNIGAEMFRLAKPFDMDFIAHDPYAEASVFKDLEVESVGLDDVFSRADFLALNCPLTDDTRHIAGTRTLALMKPTAFLINTSRGPVVDQKALYEALLERRVAGAGLDVFDPEPPPPDDPILGLDNVIVAPHSLGWTDQMFARMADVNMAAVRDLLAGRNPDNAVNPDVLARPGFKAKLARLAGTA
jgi:phosphoglycerate dehydrogenase-like enzyme